MQAETQEIAANESHGKGMRQRIDPMPSCETSFNAELRTNRIGAVLGEAPLLLASRSSAFAAQLVPSCVERTFSYVFAKLDVTE